MARRKMAVEEPMVETMEDLKAATDKYFAIRELAFDELERVRREVVLAKKFLPRGILMDGTHELVCKKVLKKWNLDQVKTESEYIEDIVTGLNLLFTASLGLSRLKLEAQNV